MQQCGGRFCYNEMTHIRTNVGTVMHTHIRKFIIILGWLAAWQLLSIIVHNNIMLVGPVETVMALIRLAGTAEFWTSISATFVRIVSGLVLGCAAGILLALLAYRKRLTREILAPFIGALKTIPIASFIILALIWIGNGNVSMFISFLVVLPMLYLNTLEGLDSLDPQLLEMADVFRIPLLSRIRYIYLPGVYPFMISGLRLALGMSWKSGVAAEVIGQPRQSIGNHFYLSKIHLDTAELLAWTVAVIVVSWAFEHLVLFALSFLDHRAAGRSPLHGAGTAAARGQETHTQQAPTADTLHSRKGGTR